MKNPTGIRNAVMIILICTLISMALFFPASAANTLVKAEASKSQLQIGDSLTVNIKILNAQELFGIDVTLRWNSTVLNLRSATHQLGVESHAGGVLHESASYPIEIVANEASQDAAQYHLSATSTGSSTPIFNGDGTIATVTFKVAGIGSTGLGLEGVEISQLPPDGEAILVVPSTTVDPTATAVPEFPTTIIIVLLMTAATATVLISAKMLKRNSFSVKPEAF
jgi:hypothetical protein